MHIVYVLAPGGGPDAYIRTLSPWLESQGHRVSAIYMAAPAQVNTDWSTSIRFASASPTQAHHYLSKAIGGLLALPLRIRAMEYERAVYRALDEIEAAEKINLVEVIEGLTINLLGKRWPVVVRAHGSDWTFRYFCQDGDTKNDHWLIELQAHQFRLARSVSAISEHLANHLSEVCNYPREAISVIPYPVNTQKFRPTAPRGAKQPILLTIGRLEMRKGADVLVRVLSRVWQRFPELKACLIGSDSGLCSQDLFTLVPKERQTQLTFPGFVDHRDLPSFYQNATIYIAPTLYETFAYTILEAMACGVPVIASRVGAVPELVDDGKTGLLVPPGDETTLSKAIIDLLDDTTMRAEMGKRAREKASEYAMEKVGPRMLEWYQGALP